MTAAAVNKSGFVMLENDLLNIEKVAGKTFTGNMKITYSLIKALRKTGRSPISPAPLWSVISGPPALL